MTRGQTLEGGVRVASTCGCQAVSPSDGQNHHRRCCRRGPPACAFSPFLSLTVAATGDVREFVAEELSLWVGVVTHGFPAWLRPHGQAMADEVRET